MNKTSHPIAKRPKSETNLWINLLGVAGFFTALFWLYHHHQLDVEQANHQMLLTLMGLLGLVAPIFLCDIWLLKTPSKAGLCHTPRNRLNITRCCVKYLGLFMTYACLWGLYWLLPEYGAFYERFFLFVQWISPYALLLALLYVPFMDRRQKDPYDSYWHMGILCIRLVIPIQERENPHFIKEHARAWLIKGFFLPLMFIFLSDNVLFLLKYDYSLLTSLEQIEDSSKRFGVLYDFSYTLIFTVDVMFAALGYMMTFRFLNSHIRSAEPTLLGWIICVICYPPFWAGLLSSRYFSYNDSFYWGDWLITSPIFYTIWGCTILLCITIYSLSTVALGYRFSNLTYRGLVTNGPYRFTKHPAYIAKCLSWWLISIPFIAPDGSFVDALKMSLMLCLVCGVYYIRARTEENHLSNYPEYVDYANWMNEHGLFRKIGQWIPYLRYSEQRAKASGSIIWSKKLASDDASIADS